MVALLEKKEETTMHRAYAYKLAISSLFCHCGHRRRRSSNRVESGTRSGWSSYVYLARRMAEPQYEAYKIRIGRSLLLGLEVAVAADVVKTIAAAPTLP